MARREYRKQGGEMAEWPASEVDAYLRGKGYLIGPGGVGTGVDGLVVADIDPNVPDATWKADMDAFQPSADPLRTARGYLIGRAREIKAKPQQQRAVTEKDLLAMIVLLRLDQ